MSPKAIDFDKELFFKALAYLRRAGMVAARREGTWMHYRIVPPRDESAAHVLAEIRDWLAADLEMKRDRARLVRVCCSPDPPPLVAGAPRPASIASCGCP
jgi:ArsR family transcriptional regulator, arsenate/arsenite/antimonite-responsive transcriptional repressor